MIRLATAFALVAAAAAPDAHARVNKCPGPDGTMIYTDQPCATAGGQKMDESQLRSNTVQGVRPPEAQEDPAPAPQAAPAAKPAPAPESSHTEPPVTTIIRVRAPRKSAPPPDTTSTTSH